MKKNSTVKLLLAIWSALLLLSVRTRAQETLSERLRSTIQNALGGDDPLSMVQDTTGSGLFGGDSVAVPAAGAIAGTGTGASPDGATTITTSGSGATMGDAGAMLNDFGLILGDGGQGAVVATSTEAGGSSLLDLYEGGRDRSRSGMAKLISDYASLSPVMGLGLLETGLSNNTQSFIRRLPWTKLMIRFQLSSAASM